MRCEFRVAFLAAVIMIIGCKPKDSFRVQVVTPDRRPVSGAELHAGSDWPIYNGETDDSGFIYVPNWANGQIAYIAKDNFFSTQAKVAPDVQVIFTPTPESLRLIGAVEGEAVRFGPETLVTITASGGYRVYTYNDARVAEVASTWLPVGILHWCVRGDTLWYTTQESGVYAYSLANPLNPAMLMHLDIQGSPGPLAVVDTFVVVGNDLVGPLRIFRYSPDGTVKLVSSFDSLFVRGIGVVSHYVVVVGWGPTQPVIYDIADVRNPREVYRGADGQFWSGFIHGNRVILNGSMLVSGQWVAGYAMLDLTDPAHPVQSGPFETDSRLYDILSDSVAVGEYDGGGITVLRGSISGGFHSVALLTEYGGYSYQGGSAPYYALYGSLWKLVTPGTK
jgi:hypothetical protein